jgi:hypothetical protein
MKKYKVGDTVHVVECGNLCRRDNAANHYDRKVTKVGRKYFYIDKHYGEDVAFHIDSGYQKTEYSPNFRIVESEQSFLEESAARELSIKLSGHFGHGPARHSLSKLKKVAAILELDI